MSGSQEFVLFKTCLFHAGFHFVVESSSTCVCCTLVKIHVITFFCHKLIKTFWLVVVLANSLVFKVVQSQELLMVIVIMEIQVRSRSNDPDHQGNSGGYGIYLWQERPSMLFRASLHTPAVLFNFKSSIFASHSITHCNVHVLYVFIRTSTYTDLFYITGLENRSFQMLWIC